MTTDLFSREREADLQGTEGTETIEPGLWTGFGPTGIGKSVAHQAVRALSGLHLIGQGAGAVAQDVVKGWTGGIRDGTEMQDRFFAGHDEGYGKLVRELTPDPREVGVAAQMAGSLLFMLPSILVAPTLGITGIAAGETEELMHAGVPWEKALGVGGVTAAGLGVGFAVPILGRNLVQRALIGGAAFNVAQGTLMRGAAAAILADDPQAARYPMFDLTYMAMDLLMGAGFGLGIQLSPRMRAQGAEGLERITDWIQNIKPSDLEAIAILRQSQHLNVDSLPGKPASPEDIVFHVEQVKRAIEQAAKNEPIDVADMPAPRFEPDPVAAKAAEEHVQELVGEAERIRAEEGIAPPPEPAPPPPKALVPQDLTIVHPDDQAAAIGRAVENRLLELKQAPEQAKAGAAIWQAFFDTAGRKYGVTPAALMQTYGIDIRHLADAQELPGAMAQAKPSGATETPAFKKWFGASKVVDEAGKPLVVYHGTPKDFNTFDQGAQRNMMADRTAQGFYFTRDPQDASRYGTIEHKPEAGGQVMPVYVSIKKPLVMGRAGEGARPEIARDIDMEHPARVSQQQRAKLEAAGYDGIIYNDGEEIVAFRPEQVKSAIGNRGTFDATDPNILYQSKAVQARWYSELARQLEAANIKAAPAKAWKDYLKGLLGKGAVKAEELKWSGIEEWLELQGGRITKEQVQEFLKANGVKVEEVVAGGKGARSLGDAAIADDVRILNEGGYPPEVNEGDTTMIAFYDRETADIITASEIRALVGNTEGVGNVVTPEILAAAERVERYWNNAPAGDRPTKFGTSDLNLPGGENYTEVRLILPGPDPDVLPKGYKIVEVDQAKQWELAKRLEDMTTRWQEWLRENEFEQLSADDWVRRYARVAGLPLEQLRYARQFERDWNDTQSMLGAGQRYALENPDGSGTVLRGAQTEEQALDQAMTLLDNEGALDRGAFRESHWEEKNVLAHVRFDERTNAAGKRGMLIQEIQTDWGQKARRIRTRQVEDLAEQRGITKEEADKLVPADAGFYDPAKPWEVFDPKTGIALKRFATELEARTNLRESPRSDELDYKDATKDRVPAAPYVGKTEAWVGLVLKRMIRHAAENNLEWIAWTTGEQQVSRYTSALRKAVDAIEWKKTPEGVQLVGYKGKATAEQSDAWRKAREEIQKLDNEIDTQLGDRDIRDLNREERQIIDALKNARRGAVDRLNMAASARSKVVDTTQKEDVLSDAIGKSMADRIRNDPNQTGTIEGENINVDDTGMATFYDRIVPNVAKEVLKKLGGGRVGSVEFPGAKAVGKREYDGAGGMVQRTAPVGWEEADTEVGLRPRKQQGFEITPELRERALAGMPLFQGGRRGQIQLGEGKNVIGLFQSADASTFMHESGHLFLQMTRDLASQPGAPIAAMDDWATIARWLKTEGGELTREHQEKFATSFERYLADGKAPTEELKGVFAQFRDWLLQIYKSLANIAEDLPDEIRGVMDRMLASQKRDPAPKAEGPPAQRAGSEPPPPPGTGEAAGTARPKAPAEDWRADVAALQGERQDIPKRGLDDLQIREAIQLMAEAEVGWEQIGGRRASAAISMSSGQPNFTKWIPKSELWPGRPDKAMNEAKTREAVRKALAGEPLRAAEQRMVDYMLEIANERLADVARIGGPEEWNATAKDVVDAKLEPSTENVTDIDLVARATAKDEIAVERAAVKYENDDQAFMAEVRKILGKDLQNQAAARGGEESEGPPAGREAPTGEAADPLEAAARDYVEANPEQTMQVGENADGTPITKTVKQYLEDELLDVAEAREDAKLVRAAAKCLMGGA